MSEFTAGPWAAVCNDRDGNILFWDIEAPREVGGQYRGSIAMVHSAEHIGGITRDERSANARLIASAPALLEALESIRLYATDTLSGRIDGPDDRAWQRAAVNEIAKRARIAIALARTGAAS